MGGVSKISVKDRFADSEYALSFAVGLQKLS